MATLYKVSNKNCQLVILTILFSSGVNLRSGSSLKRSTEKIDLKMKRCGNKFYTNVCRKHKVERRETHYKCKQMWCGITYWPAFRIIPRSRLSEMKLKFLACAPTIQQRIIYWFNVVQYGVLIISTHFLMHVDEKFRRCRCRSRFSLLFYVY